MNDHRLNRRLILEAPDRIADGAGGFLESWVELGELWADVRSRTGRERNGGDFPVSTVSYRIIVRGSPIGSVARPLPQQRFRDGARVYVINAVAELDPNGRYLTCFVDEEVAA